MIKATKEIAKVLFLFYFFFSVVLGLEAHFVADYNGVEAPLHYDVNFSSYIDLGYVNPNILVKITDNSTPILGKYAWLAYASEDGNLTVPIVEVAAKITQWNASCNCALVDLDLSMFKAVYPGYAFLVIGNKPFGEIVEMVKVPEPLNGSYNVFGYFSNGNFKIFYITPFSDTEDEKIGIDLPYLVVSAVDRATTQVIDSKIVSPSTTFEIKATPNSDIYVNGMVGLRIREFEPCGVINESGYYYVINSSKWNLTDTCLIVTADDVAVDLQDHVLQATENYTGKPCGVVVENVTNVIVKSARIFNYPVALCILNSTRAFVLESVPIGKEISLLINTSREVSGKDLVTSTQILKPEEWDVISYLGTEHRIENLTLASATGFDVEFKDLGIKHVEAYPPLPEPWHHMDRFVILENSTIRGTAIFNFTLPVPLPYRLDLYTAHLFATDYPEKNDTWHLASQLGYSEWDVMYIVNYSIVGISAPTSRFTMFAPFAKTSNRTETGGGGGEEEAKPTGAVEVPVPTPVPTPRPTPNPVPPEIDLKLLKTNFTVQAGETFEIPFEVENIGDVRVEDLIVSAFVRKGWDVLNFTTDLGTGEKREGTIVVRVSLEEIPDRYLLPVVAIFQGSVLDMEVARVDVLPRKNIARVDILQAPFYLELYPGEKKELEFLLKNTGDIPLSDVKLEFRGLKRCLNSSKTAYFLPVGVTFTAKYPVTAGGKARTCEGYFVITTKEGAKAFVPAKVRIKMPLEALAEVGTRVIVLLIWTLIVVAYYYMRGWLWRAFGSKRRGKGI